MTLQEEAIAFKQNLDTFLKIVVEETHMIRLLNFLENKLRKYFK